MSKLHSVLDLEQALATREAYESLSSFASGLLVAAIQEAKACLTAAERVEVQRQLQESTITALRKEEEEQLQFEGGAP